MQSLVRSATAALISVWGLLMILLGVVNGQILWVLLGLAVTVVGIPMLAGSPAASERLYPTGRRPPAP